MSELAICSSTGNLTFLGWASALQLDSDDKKNTRNDSVKDLNIQYLSISAKCPIIREHYFIFIVNTKLGHLASNSKYLIENEFVEILQVQVWPFSAPK